MGKENIEIDKPINKDETDKPINKDETDKSIDKAAIDKSADLLIARMQGINEWIRQNPATDPNFYEIMDCSVELAQIISLMRNYYDEVGYPKVVAEGMSEEEASEYTHYDITKFDEKAKACWAELVEMRKLRGVGYTKATPGFDNEKEASDMITEFYYRAFAGEYHILENPQLARIKKEIICKSMSVPFYIWQEQRYNPNFKYDNEGEFRDLRENYELYRGVAPQGRSVDLEGNVYEGPQFGQEIEALLDRIEKSYKYSDVYGEAAGTIKK